MALACPNCGTEHAPDARFCSSCGASLRRACPSCGTDQPASAAFCSTCGAALQSSAQRGRSSDREERKVVTVLFADLAGSTALGERLDPEDVRALQEDVFAAADGEIRRFGGVTEKFVGDAVMAVFGIPHAHEDDAERAIRAAVALRDRFGQLVERSGERYGELALRVGVNTGEVVAGRQAAARGELMVSGDAVNVAARLQQRARPSEILVGARTHAATRRSVVYEARGEAAAKGKREALAAWAVAGFVADPGQRPDGGFSAPMVGRDDELAVLRALATRVEQERAPRVVTVFGPAGVGKSRLLAEFVGAMPQARLLKGRCLPYGDGITYWPLAEALKAHANILATDPAETARGKLRAAVQASVPREHAEHVAEAAEWTIGLSMPPQTIAADEVGRRVREAWVRLFAALGRERLTVLTVEDIHWASEPLLDLLEHLVDTPEESALLVICPSRPELLDARPTWVAGRQNATALTVAPLSQDEAGQLAEALLGSAEVPAETSAAILERAGGNPFFLEEILRMLIDRGALARENGGWRATDVLDEVPLPDSVHGVIAARLDLLEPAARDGLRHCSVIGRSFWPSAVHASDDVIAALSRRGLVVERPSSTMAGMREFAFRHALIRDVAYASLPKSERRVLHGRVGDWVLEIAPGREAEVAELAAYHFEQALLYGEDDPEVRRKAFRLLLAAGLSALGRAAVGPAERLFERALERADGPAERAQALIANARVDLAFERYELALDRLRQAGEVASEAGIPTLRADALGWQSRLLWYVARWGEALEAADAAVAALAGLEETPELAAALARKSQLEMLRGAPTALEAAETAIAVARRTGNRFAAVNARVNLFTTKANMGLEPVRAEMDDVIDEAIAVGAYDEGYRAFVNYAWSAHGWLVRRELERMAQETAERLAPFPAPESYGRYIDLTLARFLHHHTGRWDRVEAAAASEELAVLGSNRLVWLDVAGGLALRRGDLASAERLLDEMRLSALASDEPQRVLPMAAVVVPYGLVVGDVELLRATTDAVFELLGRRVTPAVLEGAALPIARALGASGETARLSRLLDVMSDARVSPLGVAVTAAMRGTAPLSDGRAADAIPLLEEARSRLEALEFAYDVACLDIDLARARRETGDVRGAGELETRARLFLDRLGCVNPY